MQIFGGGGFNSYWLRFWNFIFICHSIRSWTLVVLCIPQSSMEKKIKKTITQSNTKWLWGVKREKKIKWINKRSKEEPCLYDIPCPFIFAFLFLFSFFFLFYSLIVIKHNNNIVAKTLSPSSTKVAIYLINFQRAMRKKEGLGRICFLVVLAISIAWCNSHNGSKLV